MLPDSKIRMEAAGLPIACAATGQRVPDDELASAFAVFNDAADSLGRSYGLLQVEVRQLREELDGKSRELEIERANHLRLEALAEVSSVLAHEVRNPLGSLELFSTLAAGAPELTRETREWAEQIQSGIRILAATVNNVFHSRHLPSSDLREIEVSELLRGFSGFLRPMAERQNVFLELDPPQDIDIPLNILGDPNGLQQVLLNLGLNALKAMPQGGTISIGWKHCGEWVEISIADSGTGIASGLFERIFEQGFSGHPESSGLGLAVCRRIVEQHSGSIRVQSELGHGTTMCVRLRSL